MDYHVNRVLPWAPQSIWRVLSDVSHFARDDPFHHDFTYITERKSGHGTTFRLRHTYLPIFPFAADDVVCTITQWEPGCLQTLLEKNRRAYRTHTQRFRLIPLNAATLVEYTITYKGIPSWMIPLSQWVRWKVKQRMEEKLSQIAGQCSQTEELGAGRDWPNYGATG